MPPSRAGVNIEESVFETETGPDKPPEWPLPGSAGHYCTIDSETQ